jgi:type II secretory pathway component GspD/PulD (secretin)
VTQVAATDTNVTLLAANEAAAPGAAAPADTNATTTVTNAAAEPGGVIPLIVMDDVPLTDAIKNLARQAGLNYILDPKVSFGQIGPDGKPIPQPSVSIRWENVTAGQALNALLGTYNLQLVEDPKSKIARVTVRDPAAPDPLVTKVFQLKWASPTNIVVALQNSLTDKRSKVIPDLRTSQLVVLATEKEVADMEPLIEKLDTMTRQVLIEARLLETSVNPSTAKGVDWSGTLANQHIVFGNNALPSPGIQNPSSHVPGGVVITPQLLMNFAAGSVFNPSYAFMNADGVAAVLSFLNKYADAKVLSTPRTVTLDNETADIQVTRASPIITITPGTVQVAGGSQIQYTNLGVKLSVTPRISANNYIHLKVVPEVSRIFDTVTKIVSTGSGQGAYQADEYDIRKIETRVMIPSGNTLVLGGLIQDDIRTQNSKVPLLGDIPGVGSLFRWDQKQRAKLNLLVFLTPTIVQEEDYQPTKTDFLKTPVPPHDTLEGDWSAWDSGQPRNWSKPQPSDSTKFSNVPGVTDRQ